MAKKLSKSDLVKEIEDDGHYDRVKIDNRGHVTGHSVGEPVRYSKNTNTGGRQFIGYDTELLMALVQSGQVAAEWADTYQ